MEETRTEKLSKVAVVDELTILQETDYDVLPGRKYEIAPGVIGTMVSATEAVIEEFDRLQGEIQVMVMQSAEEQGNGEASDEARFTQGRGTPKALREKVYAQVAIVLDVSGDDLDLNDRATWQNLIWPVCARVSEDFFYIKSERTSKQTLSSLERLREILSLKETMDERLASASSPGPESGGNGTVAGPIAASD